MDFNIQDFLPVYPNIVNDDTLPKFMNPEGDFAQSIYSKNEFYSLKVDAREETKEDLLYKHQKIVARFLSAYTIYDSLLLVWDMGVGKSCAAFAATEEIRKSNTGYKGALIISKGPGLLANAMEELAYKCSDGSFIPQQIPGARAMTETERKGRVKKLTGKFYSFRTFDTFTKQLEERETDQSIIDKYSNMIIIVDEVHNLRLHGSSTDTEKKKESRMYRQMHRLFHLVKNTKKLIMSGTPMKDNPVEIATVLNLILPMDRQLPTGMAFASEYLIESSKDVYSINPSKEDKLKEYIHGRVSFLKKMPSDVEAVYMGEKVPPLQVFNVVPSYMSKFQNEYYKLAYEKDSTVATIYGNSIQASRFVFPDGSYGGNAENKTSGFGKYITKTTSKQFSEGDKSTVVHDFKLHQNLYQDLKGSTDQETINNIRKYSCMYATIIETVLRNPDKLTFIYNAWVTGSGSILLGKLFELVGFARARGNTLTKKRRYAIITSSTASQVETEAISKRYSKADNLDGEYIQVIIGSNKISEGISLLNVQEIHVASPHWNYAELAQAIARGVRLDSHKALIDAGKNPIVQIYRHVALSVGVQSIDLHMYTISEKKDVSIKAVEHVIKQAAVDCALFYNRNRVGGPDGSRECEYKKCAYRCDGITTLDNVTIDYSTFELYYAGEKIKKAIAHIGEMFSKRFFYSAKDIIHTLKEFNTFEIFTALKKIISENIYIKNKYGFYCYLREVNDVLFLVDSLAVGNDFISSLYTKYPVVLDEIKYEEYLEDGIVIPRLQKNIEMAETTEDVGQSLIKLPELLQRYYIEGSLRSLTSVGKLVREYALHNRFNADFTKYRLKDKMYCLQDDGSWLECDGIFEEEVDNPYNYSGLFNPDNNSFCIKKETKGSVVDARKVTTGKVCSSSTIPELIATVLDLEMPYENNTRKYKNIDKMSNGELLTILDNTAKAKNCYDKSMSADQLRRALYYIDRDQKGQICDLIKDWFSEHKLLKMSNTCGNSGAVKKKA